MTSRECLTQFATHAEVLSPTRFRINNDEMSVDAEGPDDFASLTSALESALYAYLYTRSRQTAALQSLSVQREFVTRLSAANVGTGTFESGWVIRNVEADGTVAAEKEGLTVFAQPHEVTVEKGHRSETGAPCAVRIGKEYRALMPGFYMAFSDAPFSGDSGAGPLVRLYWHVSSAGAPPLIRALTLELNKIAVPFRLKTLNDPNLYSRADAAVLYLARENYAKARGALLRVHGLVRRWLMPDVPMLTKPVGRGVGLAEDPGDEAVSFGQHRCRVVAEALVKCYQGREPTFDSRLQEISSAFEQQGFDLTRLYLQPGSRDLYPSLERRSRERRQKRR